MSTLLDVAIVLAALAAIFLVFTGGKQVRDDLFIMKGRDPDFRIWRSFLDGVKSGLKFIRSEVWLRELPRE